MKQPTGWKSSFSSFQLFQNSSSGFVKVFFYANDSFINYTEKKTAINAKSRCSFLLFYCRTESISETVCAEGLSGSRVFIKKRTGIGSNQLADLLMKSVRALAFTGIKKKKKEQPSLQ